MGGRLLLFRSSLSRLAACSTLVLLCFCLPAILFIALCDSQAAEIESVIPAYSIAYVAVRDIPSIWDAVKASSSWQAFLSSDTLGDEMQWVTAGVERVRELLGVDIRALAELLGHRLAFVQIHVDAIATSLPAIVADVGNSEGASEMVWKIEQSLGSYEEYEIQSQGGTYLTVPFGLVKRRGQEFAVRYAFLDNLFLIALEQDTFEAVVNVYLGKEPSLIYDPKFNKARAEVPADGEVFAYVNLEFLWPIIWNLCDSELGGFLQILGLHETKSVSWSTNLLADTREQQMYIYTGDDRGLLVSLFADPGSPSLRRAETESLLSPHLIPASDADMFLAARLGNPEMVWEDIKDAVRNVAGEEDHAQMQSEISEFEREAGLSLKDDLLSSLNGEFGIAMSFPESSAGALSYMDFLPLSVEDGLIAFCGVEDRERCAMSIERMLSAGNAPVEQMERKGVTVYYTPVLSGREVPAAYMFAGDLLIFGNFEKLEAIINEEPPLVVSKEFAQINSHLVSPSQALKSPRTRGSEQRGKAGASAPVARNSEGPEYSGLLYYVDLKRTGEMLLRRGSRVQSGDDIARLQTLGSIGGTLIHDEEGLKARSVGTPGKSWLETIGDLADLLIHAPF